MTLEQKIERKMRKLARRCAEAATYRNEATQRCFAGMVDVWTEAYQLIRLAGYQSEYRKRVEKLERARMV